MSELATATRWAGPCLGRAWAKGTRRRASSACLVLLLLLLGAACLALGCGTKRDDSSRALRRRAEPFLREFESFDGWARRSFDADLALSDPAALAETLFAPIRREPLVVAAWVEREGADPRALGLRTDTALSQDWVDLRGVPMLARLQAAETELPDTRTRRAPDAQVLVLSRSAPSARGGGDVRVTVAFDLELAASDE